MLIGVGVLVCRARLILLRDWHGARALYLLAHELARSEYYDLL